MATTAIFAEILIAGLGALAWLSLLVISFFGTDWFPRDFVSSSPVISGVGVFAMAYILGIFMDRMADSVFDWLKKSPAGKWLNRTFGEDSHSERLPEKVGTMRLTVMKESDGMAKFLDYQRSRMRVARATAINLAALIPTLLVFGIAGSDLSTASLILIEVMFCLFLFLALFSTERIGSAWIKRLAEAYSLIHSEDTGTVSQPIHTDRRPVENHVVAAVCYRHSDGITEFLIVRTSGGKRWTFPKGKIEPGESPAEAAQREAREEAGVQGSIESTSFIQYTYLKSPTIENFVSAYLLRVDDQADPAPLERGRDPEWLSPQDAKVRLAKNRSTREAREHEKVIEAALARIHGTNL